MLARDERRCVRNECGAASSRFGPLETVIVAVAVLGIAVLLVRPAWHEPATALTGFTHVRVESGDTLWSLADRHRPDGVGTQEFVRTIRDANRLVDSSLLVGQVLEVPVAEPRNLASVAP